MSREYIIVIYLLDLQVLRGISIIFIVLFHYNITKYGFRAVDVFILISGFIIYYQYENSKSLILFYIHRIKRIIILSYLIQFLILFFTTYNGKYRTANIVDEYNSALLFVSNYYYYYIKNDYFSSSTNNVFLHYWYLSMDIHFYFIYPLFHNQHRIFVIIYYIIYIYIYNKDALFCYYFTIPRLYEYFLGNLSFSCRIINNKHFKYISVTLLCFNILYSFNNYHISNLIIVSLTFIYMINNYQFINAIVIENIGNISYALYLIHYPQSQFNKSIFWFLLLYPLSVLFSNIQNSINDYLKYANLKFSIVFILLYYICCRSFSHVFAKNKQLKGKNNHLQSFNENCCYKRLYSRNDILIVGDSHAYIFVENLLTRIGENRYVIYWKYVCTKWIIKNYKEFIYNIMQNFYLIITMNLLYYRWIRNNISDFAYYYTNYINYLKIKCKYLVVYKPTPTLNEPLNCIAQIRKKIGIINKNISLAPFLLDVNYNKYMILKDLSNYYCNNKVCNLVYNKHCIYIDDNHLNSLFLTDIIDLVKNELIKYFPKNVNKSLTCNKYIIYNDIIPYNWYFVKSKCIKSYYDKKYFA